MNRLSIVIFFLGLFSCNAPVQVKGPADLIGREQFVEILKDVRLLEGAYTTRYVKIDSSAFKIDSYYLKLFSDHGITRDRFLKSYEFYTSDLELMMAIEDNLIAKLTIMQTAQDSINRNINTLTLDSIATENAIPMNH